MVRMPKNTQVNFPCLIFNLLGKMKKKETVSEYDRIKKILAYMDFATKLKIAQEEGKKRRQKDSDK